MFEQQGKFVYPFSLGIQQYFHFKFLLFLIIVNNNNFWPYVLWLEINRTISVWRGLIPIEVKKLLIIHIILPDIVIY